MFFFTQEQQFGELEKNSDKQLVGDSRGQMDPPSHFHQLLSGLHKHLLAHCYISSSPEVNKELCQMQRKMSGTSLETSTSVESELHISKCFWVQCAGIPKLVFYPVFLVLQLHLSLYFWLCRMTAV